jgi:aminoglycoside 6'-N-acetyltransferase
MNSGLDPAALRFRPLELEELPLLHRWMYAPHAQRWWSRNRTVDDVIAQYTPSIAGEIPIHALMVAYDAAPIGVVEWIRFGHFPSLMQAYGVADPEAVGCGVLIGEESFAHHGLGGPMVCRFLREVPFRDPRCNACFIDPERENLAAIRAYEKAGFHFVRDTRDEEGVAIHLMALTREDLH